MLASSLLRGREINVWKVIDDWLSVKKVCVILLFQNNPKKSVLVKWDNNDPLYNYLLSKPTNSSFTFTFTFYFFRHLSYS